MALDVPHSTKTTSQKQSAQCLQCPAPQRAMRTRAVDTACETRPWQQRSQGLGMFDMWFTGNHRAWTHKIKGYTVSIRIFWELNRMNIMFLPISMESIDLFDLHLGSQDFLLHHSGHLDRRSVETWNGFNSSRTDVKSNPLPSVKWGLAD